MTVGERGTILTNVTTETFKELTASLLFCNRCRRAVPVHERLLLVLADGELREYRCRICQESLGTKKVSLRRPTGLIVP